MKILCLSDEIDPMVYNSNAAKIFPDIDVILCAGDLPMDYIDFIVSVFNKPTFFIFGNHHLKEFSQYHNSSPITSDMSMATNEKRQGHGAVYAGFKNIKDKSLVVIDSRTGKKTPLLITGTSGCLKYNNGLNQYTEREMFFKLLKLVPGLLWNKLRYGRAMDIFLCHATPLGIHDKSDLCHRGFKCFLPFIDKFKPTYLVHGHIHIYDNRTKRVTQYKDTSVVNVFSHYILEFPKPEKQDDTE